MRASRTGMVALVLLVVASTIVSATKLAIKTTNKKTNKQNNKPTKKTTPFKNTTPLTRVSFQRISGIKTNGLEWSQNTPKETPWAVPDLTTISNIITFIRKSIDKKGEDEKLFYIGRGSYAIKAKPNEDPNKSSAVRIGQITALTNRHDDKKVEAFDRFLRTFRQQEMVLLYDTVVDPNVESTEPLSKISHVRSHATLEALLIHIFCNKPPKKCLEKRKDLGKACEYFPADSHYSDRATTLGDILATVEPLKDITAYHNDYDKYCDNSNAGTINGALAKLNAGSNIRDSERNRGVLYYVGVDIAK